MLTVNSIHPLFPLLKQQQNCQLTTWDETLCQLLNVQNTFSSDGKVRFEYNKNGQAEPNSHIEIIITFKNSYLKNPLVIPSEPV